MESDLIQTPKKMSPALQLANEQKSFTPLIANSKYNSMSKRHSTPNKFRPHGGKLLMFENIPDTPPSKFSKVINPFEVGLIERLHLPLICSPLFHCPNTPLSSPTHFEWNIDEMSSLNPCKFDAHESQFLSTTDPDIEARAQAAISSFFSDQFIVPSPVDCPLRNQKIVLSNESFESNKNTRNGICQTELSLPPNLPKKLEDYLQRYFSQTMDQQQSPVRDCDSIDSDNRDTSSASFSQKCFEETSHSSSLSN